VWYVNVPGGPDLECLLTDRADKLRGRSVPAGMVSTKLTAEIHAAATSELHPRFVELVQRTPDPFIQSILDVVVARMAFGRVCLLGDAAFVLRPHAAAATAKVAADAMSLGGCPCRCSSRSRRRAAGVGGAATGLWAPSRGPKAIS
jgi:2,6-dihydroxypyridine 3-monooxygenase